MTPEEIKKGETDRLESMESFWAERIGNLQSCSQERP